jgi:5-carboxyvanillate decarboxylase
MKIIGIEEHIGGEGFNRIEQRLRDMDEAGIDMQVLSAGSSEPGVVIPGRKTNDSLAEIIRKYPERFSGFATLPFHDPPASAKELERAVKDLGLKGVMVGPELNGEYLDMAKYQPILEMAEKLDVPIYVHPAEPSPDMIKPYLTYPILTRASWGFAAQGGLHAMRLIYSGTFDKFPNLRIILGHLGENIPFQLWRMDNHWSLEQGRPQLRGADPSAIKLKKTPGQYFKDNFYVTTSGMFWHNALQFVLSVLGSERVLFSVDYPFESNKVAVEFIKSAPISDIDKRKICYLNAERVLRLQ